MKRFSFTSHFNQKRPFQSRGFTLVELMVALTLFVVVVLAAVSSLYSVNNASRKVSAMRSVLDNLNFAIESMSRTIRTGDNFVCGGLPNQGGGANSCSFDTTSGTTRILLDSTLGIDQEIEYQWESPNGVTGEIQKRTLDSNGRWSEWVAITAPEIDVQIFKLYINGADDDTIQPSVMMFIKGVASAGDDNTAPFSIQTLVSQRSTE